MKLETSIENTSLDFTYNTGLEVYDSEGSLDLIASVRRIEENMISRNPEKHSDFGDKKTGIGNLAGKLGLLQIDVIEKFFQYTDFSMRLLDDLCDGDIDTVSPEVINQIIINALNGRKTDEEKTFGLFEILLSEVYRLGSKLGIGSTTQEGTREIIESLRFDFLRANDDDPWRTQTDLEEHFHQQDINGVVRITAAMLGFNPEDGVAKLQDLSYASRHAYNIHDLVSDIKNNLINIYSEERDLLGISDQDIKNIQRLPEETRFDSFSSLYNDERLPEGIKKWLVIERNRMLNRFEAHKKNFTLTKGRLQLIGNRGFIRGQVNNLIMNQKVYPVLFYPDIEYALK